LELNKALGGREQRRGGKNIEIFEKKTSSYIITTAPARVKVSRKAEVDRTVVEIYKVTIT